jgi:hypothetical protein
MLSGRRTEKHPKNLHLQNFKLVSLSPQCETRDTFTTGAHLYVLTGFLKFHELNFCYGDAMSRKPVEEP